jgi:hypothetical protein
MSLPNLHPRFKLARVADDPSLDEEVKDSALEQELKGDFSEDEIKGASSEDEARGTTVETQSKVTSSKAKPHDTDLLVEFKRLTLNQELKATSRENKLTNPVPDSVNIPEHEALVIE